MANLLLGTIGIFSLIKGGFAVFNADKRALALAGKLKAIKTDTFADSRHEEGRSLQSYAPRTPQSIRRFGLISVVLGITCIIVATFVH